MTTNQLLAPDLINPSATFRLLESTGITPPESTLDLLDELHEAVDLGGPADAARSFLHPGHENPVERWCAIVAAHLYDGDAPDTLRRPAWTRPSLQRGRPLTRAEQALCRVAVNRWDERSTVTPAQYALAEKSATSGELIRMPVSAVAIAGQATVELSGGRDQIARSVTLDEWGTRLVIRRLEAIDTTDRSAPLLYVGDAPGTAKAQASASGNLTRVLRIAGLGDDRTLTPTSIRNTCAVRMHETGEGIEAITATMGAKSLDGMWRMVHHPAPR